jgi:hypothetical protein
MKKLQTLKLNRETVRLLVEAETLHVRAGLYRGDAFNCTGCDSGCGIID